MSDPESTLPPLGARTPRNMLRWLWAWLLAHPVVLAAGAGFLAGAILPRIVWWLVR